MAHAGPACMADLAESVFRVVYRFVCRTRDARGCRDLRTVTILNGMRRGSLLDTITTIHANVSEMNIRQR